MKTIRITVEGGIIQDIENIPPDVCIEVWDFDTDGVEDANLTSAGSDSPYILSIYEGGS